MRSVAVAGVQSGVSPSFVGNQGFRGLTRASAGVYRLELDNNYDNDELSVQPSLTILDPGDVVTVPKGSIASRVLGTGPTYIHIFINDVDGAPADFDFYITATTQQ